MMATQAVCRVLVAVATVALVDTQATSVAQTLAIPPKVVDVGALAMPPDPNFLQEGLLSVPESYPFGPGDRGTNLKLKMLSGENTASVEYWVLYSSDKALLAGAHLASDFSKGKATLTNMSNGDVIASFIFPHSDNPKPNSSYVRPTSFAPGKTVYYKWIKKKGSEEFPSQIVQFSMPEKLTIANFGDSYASGEGAPYDGSKKWDDEKCHRSGNSGQAKAVKQFKDDHPGTAVAFKNVACSGAGVNEGIIGPQYHKPFLSDDNHATPITPQVEQVRQWMISNDYDTLNIALLSIGINEIGFGGVVTDYFVGVGDLVGAQAKRVHISNDVKGLEADYRSVHDAFDRSFAYDYVLVSQYPDLSHDQHRHFNGVPLELHGGCWGPVEITSDNDEYKLIFDIDTAMNDKIGSVVHTFPKWTQGGDAMEASILHGLSNCDDPWFNTIGASLATQGDVGGTFHPNRVGHEKFCKPLILHDLNFLYAHLTKQASVERNEQIKKAAKDIAIAAAKKKSAALTLLAHQTALAQSTHVVESVATAKTIPADILEKARLSASQVARLTGGVDNKIGDDDKP